MFTREILKFSIIFYDFCNAFRGLMNESTYELLFMNRYNNGDLGFVRYITKYLEMEFNVLENRSIITL
jgi:hypothetical protein